MKARIWKDRQSGAWCYEFRGCEGLFVPGERRTWELALSSVLAHIAAHRLTHHAARM